MTRVALLTLAFMAMIAVACGKATLEGSLRDAGSQKGKIWALLVAGSKGWLNYRHQADVCHAYHVLHNHGIPDEQIVVMMYDDIAYNENNNYPGIIINAPNGPNVYLRVPKDYTGDDVTPQNFLHVLQGRADLVKHTKGSHKVINSGPDDHVFVYFADHGGHGLVGFPNDMLYAKDLNDTIFDLHRQKRYSKLVLYVEACDAGSMFEGILSPDINVYATTAANNHESAYACYWDEALWAFLGDCYSINWMEDSDKEDLHKETLEKQFRIVKNETKKSHVCEYGDLQLAKSKVSEFQGEKQAEPIVAPKFPFDEVDSREVALVTLRKKLAAAAPEERESIAKQIEDILSKRSFVDMTVEELAKEATFGENIRLRHVLKSRFPLRGDADHLCYKASVRHFDEHCFDLSDNPYALAKLGLLSNLCALGHTPASIRAAIEAVCTHDSIVGAL
ncbi:legumain-like [Ornithodoros turicata]|uniref:legumain-like n=1 Tax=Ornithodoros turicata TaxID=34597 RepID=UPI003139E879